MTLPNPIPINPAWLPGGVLPDDPGGDGRTYRVVNRRDGAEVIRIGWSRGDRKMLRRKRYILPSDWAETHISLPQDAPIPGKWKKDLTPYFVGVIDASFFPSVQEILVCAAPQTGKSQASANCIGYAIDRKPGNVVLNFPDEKTAGEYSKDRLLQMIRDSRRLRSYMTGYDDDAASMRIKMRHMKIYLAWANSAARLAWRSAPYGIADEEDKYPAQANKKEGSPVDLLRKRARNFPHMRKLWRLSSPTIESDGISKGLFGYKDTAPDAEVVFGFHVRCPACNARQHMTFDPEHFIWPGGSGADANEVETKKLAYYQCDQCNAQWDDATRDRAVRAGEWYDRKSGIALFAYLSAHRPRAIGFVVPAWLSPFVSMSECAAAFLRGLGNPTKMMDFNNGYAATASHTYRKDREESKILLLRDDRPASRVPGGGVVAGLLAAVDTQDHGFWYRIRAFGWGGVDLLKESWGVRDGYLTTWGALENVLWRDVYYDADGNRYPVLMAIQDALGHRTSEVYDFCRKHRGHIFPSFGRDVMAQPYTWRNLEYYPGGKKPIPGGLQALNVNTKYFKDELARLLEIAPSDPGAWHENADFTEDWARQMTAEFTNEKGLWECPSHKANHLWDCASLCLVAHEVMGMMHWPKPDNEDAGKKKPAEPNHDTWSQRREFKRPDWLNR